MPNFEIPTVAGRKRTLDCAFGERVGALRVSLLPTNRGGN